ncbi:pale cress protein (PAC) [Wolffia australiana]
MWATARAEQFFLKSLVPVRWKPLDLKLGREVKFSRIPLAYSRNLSLRAVSGIDKEKDIVDDGEFPDEFYDEEWQARQREKTKEWHAYRAKEEEKENKKVEEYRDIGSRLKAYPEEEVRKAKILVSKFIRAGEEIEQTIEEAADDGELTELVLLVIWNRLDLARRDEERDAIRSLDLLYRRVETEILKRESSPSMRLLNDLLNLHDGFDDDEWLKTCKKCMMETFPAEDPFSILVPTGFDVDSHHGRIELKQDNDDVLLRADFIREVDGLLREVRSASQDVGLKQPDTAQDAESVANMLKQHERQRAIRQVEALLDLAISLKW